MPDKRATFEKIAETIDRFTETIGFDHYAVYVFDYGAPTGFRIEVRHPERITAIISQNGNAYEEGLSEGWNPIRAYWQDASAANREALRAFLKPEATIWQYTHGASDPTGVSPDGYSPAAGRGNVVLFCGRGNHVGLRGLPGGAEGIRDAVSDALVSSTGMLEHRTVI